MQNEIVVTGALGFIGHHMVQEIQNHYKKDWGHRLKLKLVDNVSPTTPEERRLFAARHKAIGNRYFYNVAADTPELYEDYEKWGEGRVLIHFAGHPNQAAVAKDTLGGFENIVGTTANLCHIANKHKFIMVYISSSMAYGHFQTPVVDEAHALHPVNLYGLYKSQGEALVRNICNNYIIIRPSAVYGPLDSPTRVLSKWALESCLDEKMIVKNGSQQLDFTYVTDLTDGIWRAITRFRFKPYNDKPHGETYNMTAGAPRSLSEAAALVRYYTESRSPIWFDDQFDASVPKRGGLDISKAKELLKYRPNYNLESGLFNLVKWTKEYYADQISESKRAVSGKQASL